MKLNPRIPYITVHSPHGEWKIGLSLYPGDFLPASDMVGYAFTQGRLPA